MKTQLIQEKIDKKKKELEILEKELKESMDKTEWLYIPELKIEVKTKIHGFNQTLADSIKELKKDESVIDMEQLLWLRNSKYAEQLNLIKTWEFISPNPDKIMRDKGYVAQFFSGSDRSDFVFYGDADYSDGTLGVRFVRKKVTGVKNV